MPDRYSLIDPTEPERRFRLNLYLVDIRCEECYNLQKIKKALFANYLTYLPVWDKLEKPQQGAHLGSPREVVTRMRKYFVNEGWIVLSRGTATVLDEKKLCEIAEG